ncbi:3-keto-steroid reductase [Phyllosticta citribraziliensis]|uniref:3-keto-steroid reductase n=1 Tax=Phyllosticta citribraziliensis TaxID=989973 RepID=A0ABR1MCE1_9PEZI
MESSQLDPNDTFYAIVTGANSGVGLATCCRLIDEFLQTRPQSHTLVLIPTTRSSRKSDDTVKQLRAHLAKTCQKSEKRVPGIGSVLEKRVRFQAEMLDLCSLISVQACGRRLRNTIPKLDVLICNAGIGGWTGLNWWRATYKILTDWVHSTTWPEGFKIASVGLVTGPQVPPTGSAPPTAKGKRGSGGTPEPPLGEVFCANVFGHYLLGHYCAPLLKAARPQAGRIIWTSSLEAYASEFKLEDFQGLTSNMAYESGKRLTDVLALTYDTPAARPYSSRYFETDDANTSDNRPRMYLSHPGIVNTAIISLPFPWIMNWLYMVALYIGRWLGSQWHTVEPYTSAVSAVWLALAAQSTLEQVEGREGKGKWGSATDRMGNERVMRTEVEGWGFGGIVGDCAGKKGRKRGAVDLKEGERDKFEGLGSVCWREMEKLREEWEGRLAAA